MIPYVLPAHPDGCGGGPLVYDVPGERVGQAGRPSGPAKRVGQAGRTAGACGRSAPGESGETPR